MILFETKLCLHINGFATHVFLPECSEISLLQSLLHTHTSELLVPISLVDHKSHETTKTKGRQSKEEMKSVHTA